VFIAWLTRAISLLKITLSSLTNEMRWFSMLAHHPQEFLEEQVSADEECRMTVKLKND